MFLLFFERPEVFEHLVESLIFYAVASQLKFSQEDNDYQWHGLPKCLSFYLFS